MQAFFDLFSVLILIAAGLTLIAGGLNALFDWNLALKIGGSTIPLPDDFTSVVACVIVLALLSGLCFVLAHTKQVTLFTRQRYRATLILLALTTALLVIGVPQLFPNFFLELAVQEGNSTTAQAMLKKRTYPAPVLNELTYWSLKNEDYILTQMLFDQGADINHRRGQFETTLLHDAVIWFAPSATDFLLEKGAEVDAKDTLGRTALHLLLTYRADNQKQEDEAQLLKMVKQLVAAGADRNIAQQNGETPLTLTRTKGYGTITQFLQQS